VIGADDEKSAIEERRILVDGGHDTAKFLIDGTDHIAVHHAAPVQVVPGIVGFAQVNERVMPRRRTVQVLQ